MASAPDRALKSVLNSMKMSAGIAWHPNASQIQDSTQGCLASRAKMPLTVSILVLLVLAAFLALLVTFIALNIRQKRMLRRMSTTDARVIERCAPIGLLEWIKYGMQQSSGGQKWAMLELEIPVL